MLDKDKLDIVYMRLSREDIEVATGAKAESMSISSQRLCLQQYFASNPDLDHYEELIDDGYSGTNFNRPGVTQLLKLVEEGRVRTIIVRDLSRFARNYLEAGHFLEYVFPAYDVRFISINDHYDSKDLGESTAGLHLAVRNLVNQLYSRDISRKIKSSVDLKKMNGEYVYGTAPFGYRKGEKKNTLVVDAVAATTVKQIFQWASDGTTVTQIAAKLNAAGIVTPSVYLKDIRGKYKVRTFWTYESVRNILTNRIYTGDTVPFKSHVVKVGSDRVKHIPEEEQLVLPETHEAIVSREMYYLSRSVIKSNTKSKPKGPSSVFSTYLVCGCCGNKLQKGKASNRKFFCATARYLTDSECKAVYINEELLSSILLRAIQTQCQIADAKLQAIKSTQKDAALEHNAIRKDLQTQQQLVEKCKADAIRHYEAYVSGDLSKEAFLEKKAACKKLEADVTIQVKSLSEQLASKTAQAESAEAMMREALPLIQYRKIESLSPELLKALVKNITVYPGGDVNIVWNFADLCLPEEV